MDVNDQIGLGQFAAQTLDFSLQLKINAFLGSCRTHLRTGLPFDKLDLASDHSLLAPGRKMR